MKASWRPLEDVFRLRLEKTSSTRLQDALIYFLYSYVFRGRLDQAQYIHLGNTSSRRFQDVFKMSCKIIFKKSSRRLQDVLLRRFRDLFKTSCLAKAFSRPLQNVFKTFSRRFQDVFKTSSRHLQDVLRRCLQDVFKTYHQDKPFFLTRFQVVLETSSKRF